MDDVPELSGSLMSIPLSCWSPFSPNFTSTFGMETVGAVLDVRLIGFSQALTGGAGAGMCIAKGTALDELVAGPTSRERENSLSKAVFEQRKSLIRGVTKA